MEDDELPFVLYDFKKMELDQKQIKGWNSFKDCNEPFIKTNILRPYDVNTVKG